MTAALILIMTQRDRTTFRQRERYFEADDMTLINLECVLSDATERVEKRWNLKGKPSYIGIMTGSSIEACSLGIITHTTMDKLDWTIREMCSTMPG